MHLTSICRSHHVMAVALSILAASLQVYAQPSERWLRVYGGPYYDDVRDIEMTADSGFVAVGSYSSQQMGVGFNSMILRMDSDGDSLWGLPLVNEGSGSADVRRIIPLGNDEFLAVGDRYRNEDSDRDLFVVKFTAAGETLWTRMYGGPGGQQCYAGVRCGDGGFAFASWETGPVFDGVTLLRMNEAGDSLWSRNYSWYGVCFSMDRVPAGGFILAGIHAGALSTEGYVLRVDEQGDTLWSRGCPGYDYSSLVGVATLEDDGFAAVGHLAVDSPGLPEIDICYLRLNADGDTIYTRRFYESHNQQAFGFNVLNNGDLLITGRYITTEPGPIYTYAYARRITATGEERWSFRPTTEGGNMFYTGLEVADGGILLGGRIAYRVNANFDWWFSCVNEPLGVDPPAIPLPVSVTLSGNFPNPFNASTEIVFELTHPAVVRLTVHDLLGREVVRPADEPYAPGQHRVLFDGTRLASGVYFCRLEADGVNLTRKMILMR